MSKAIILAAGLGTRMRKADSAASLDPAASAAADSGVKALIPIDRPFLDYLLHALAEATITDVCLVIGATHTQLRDYYSALPTRRLKIHFAIQEKPLGTANAVAAAESFAASDPFLMLNSDNYYPIPALRALAALPSAGAAVFTRQGLLRDSNIAADRIAKFALVRTTPDGLLQQIIEKPAPAAVAALGPNPAVSMNCWRFTPAIFAACRAIPLSSRGEYEITDAVQYALDRLHEPFRILPFDLGVLDLSSRADIAPVRQRLAGTPVNL